MGGGIHCKRLGGHRARPYTSHITLRTSHFAPHTSHFAKSVECRAVPKIPKFGDFEGQSLEFPLTQIPIFLFNKIASIDLNLLRLFFILLFLLFVLLALLYLFLYLCIFAFLFLLELVFL